MSIEPKKETNIAATEEAQETKPASAKYTEREKAKISKWVYHQDQLGFEYEVCPKDDNAENKNITHLRPKFNNRDLEEEKANLIALAALAESMGTTSPKLAHLLKRDVLNGFHHGNDAYDAGFVATAILEGMLELKPADSIEAMLISQMLVLQNQSMRYMSMAAQAEYAKNQDRHINNATKLMRLFNEKLDTLNRYRRKGEQKVTVQHVNVNQGGQAIVGNVVGGGDSSKK